MKLKISNPKINFDFIHKKGFVSLTDVEILNKTFEHIKNDRTYTSPHSHITQLNPNQIKSESIFKILSKKIEFFFAEELGLSDLKLAKLWLVTSVNKNTIPSVLPYIPHFDKHRFLKAMVYLHDVTENHGPIHLGRIDENADIEHRRNNLPVDYKVHGLNTIEKKDIVNEMTPMVGSTGDVIFFDTNTAHKAGIVAEGFERRVLRFDFDFLGLNVKPSFIKKVLNKCLKI